MGLDTKYRPSKYSDVLGQESTISILREVVSQGKGFQQSYCFFGPFGSGKTTLAKLLGKSLMCETPDNGEACGKCDSCTSYDGGRHPDLIEVDAGSNSKKEDMERILEQIKYLSFSGRRKVFIMEESHELSTAAQDAMLLPMENCHPDSQDKQLVCIFTTTDPAKMRSAILSRCYPSFPVKPTSADQISTRLESVARLEKIEYEREALLLIAELTELHVRDALKALEALSLRGKVTRSLVMEYYHQDLNSDLISILEAVGTDKIYGLDLESLIQKVSVSSLYKRLSEFSILAFRLSKNKEFPIASHLDASRLRGVGDEKGIKLLEMAKLFSSRPYHVDKSTLFCDLALCGAVSQGNSPSSSFSFSRKPETSGSIKPDVSGLGVYVDPSLRKKLGDKPQFQESEKKVLSNEEAKKKLMEELDG